MLIEPIGYVESPYLTKSGVPRQPGLIRGALSRLVLNQELPFEEAYPGVEAGDWMVLLWAFSHNVREKNAWPKTVRPPILGGTQRMGVFATRSSFRPNNLALSCVQVDCCHDRAIEFRGGDMVSGTPVYDVYPYQESAHCVQDASGGWPCEHSWPSLKDVIISEDAYANLDGCDVPTLRDFLLQDPRPAYARTGQESREFWTAYDEWLIWYAVHGEVLHLAKAKHLSKAERDELLLTGKMPNKYTN